MSNTNILIKRSASTSSPGSLLAGEFAYSYASNTLFLGNAAGNGVVNVGGLLYTQAIDNATDAATANRLVKRDGSGNASFNTIYGKLGDTFSTLTAGTYGSTTAIPVLTIAANGQVTNAYTASITTALTVSGDTGTDTVDLATEILEFTGGQGITSSVAANTVTLNVDDTVLRSNIAGFTQFIQTDLDITGNVYFRGNVVTNDVTTLNISDPLIYLAANNYSSDVVDIGFAANYYDGATNRHTGLVRHAANKEYYLFQNYDKEPDNNIIDINDASFRTANLHANLVSSYALVDKLDLNTALTVPSGGTGKTSFTSGRLVVGNGTGPLEQLANVTPTVTGSLAASKTITSLTVDDYGRVTAYTGADIAIAASQITSGTLGVPRGGTGQSSFTNGAIVIGNDTGALQTLANTSFTPTGSGASNNTITSVTVDAYGRFTAATFSAISGLTVGQGGTGVSSFTSNGILYGNGSGAVQVTAAPGTDDMAGSQQLLTATVAGVPKWTTALDGGTF